MPGPVPLCSQLGAKTQDPLPWGARLKYGHVPLGERFSCRQCPWLSSRKLGRQGPQVLDPSGQNFRRCRAQSRRRGHGSAADRRRGVRWSSGAGRCLGPRAPGPHLPSVPPAHPCPVLRAQPLPTAPTQHRVAAARTKSTRSRYSRGSHHQKWQKSKSPLLGLSAAACHHHEQLQFLSLQEQEKETRETETRVSGCWGVKVLGCWDVRVSVLRCWDVKVLGCQIARVLECQGVGMSGCWDVRAEPKAI